MKHFLDLGSHEFEGLRKFCDRLSIDDSWSVYCYEANSIVYEKALESVSIFETKFHKFHFYNRAVLDKNGVITFHCHRGAWKDSAKNEFLKEYTVGSNALKHNPQCDIANGVVFDVVDMNVECIDINNILDRICDQDPMAEIYIKCDIEGSEFCVVPRLLESKHIRNIKQMYIEWHERFWHNKGMKKRIREKNSYLNRLKELKIECFATGNLTLDFETRTLNRLYRQLIKPVRRLIIRMKYQYPSIFGHC